MTQCMSNAQVEFWSLQTTKLKMFIQTTKMCNTQLLKRQRWKVNAWTLRADCSWAFVRIVGRDLFFMNQCYQLLSLPVGNLGRQPWMPVADQLPQCGAVLVRERSSVLDCMSSLNTTCRRAQEWLSRQSRTAFYPSVYSRVTYAYLRVHMYLIDSHLHHTKTCWAWTEKICECLRLHP